MNIMKKIGGDQLKKRPDVKVGDTVKLHMKIREGSKERIQIFEGVVMSLGSSGINQTVTVRKISYGIGVERVVPMHSNLLEKIEVVKRGSVKKSRLFYLRDRVGRRALKVGNVKDLYLTDEVEVPEVGEQEEVVKEETEE
ncbi:50S ribosomal protein L19 [Candidatus Dojkabacteria bacterium HGW-Dojkabacteria-1]|uniref:50S ribosomal protein L19 n=1 Tax=Candidatus Dojkabacteria bacterium HGW-Dojkabacteria-1 TaxID=2013761 RepID=A0A2N2F4N4_9BACT|nr:MAG: 50S ribosomal protein L19 [Candidatus Dojkabacteria bacterium HGW-Dojkabacteria-1]